MYDEHAPEVRGLVVALVSAAAFGVSGSLAKGLLEAGWSSGAVAVARNGLGALLLAPVALPALVRARPSRREWGVVVVYGLLAVAGTQLFFFNAVERLDVGVALLVEYLAPVLLVAWSWARTRVRPGGRTLLGSAVALVGMVLVVDLTGGVEVDPVGVGWGLAAALGLAAYFVISARPLPRVPPVGLAGGGTAIGSLVLALAGVAGLVPLRAGTADAALLGAPRPWWVVVVLLGLVSCAVAYVTGIVAASALGERVASFVGLTEVLFAVLFAWLLLGELPALVQLAGGVLVLAGLVLVRSDRPRRRLERAAQPVAASASS